ncbi:VOC family protein [Roseiterribacter gracilis]|uniref:Lyase n=1 Tax=Roseiterribacter gracilis TaxID=2812848 RepID=A0A8S8XD56_9PROT|nr:lyase [Rhodospirillales bacterium TMPK1]
MAIDVRGVAPLLQVFDMPRAIAFYRDRLGFELVNASAPGDECNWCMLRLGGAWLMLNTAYDPDDERPASPDPARQAAHRDTGLFFECPDVDAAFAHLRAQGIDVAPPKIAPYGMKQLYVVDPDGFELCFQHHA